MVNVIISSGGTSGPQGFGWRSGAGVPAATLGVDGDFYLDTTNVGFYYGPKAAGAWGTPHPFGNSLNGVPLANTTATTAPGAGNDGTQGYVRGSTWINTTTNLVYTCTSSATGAAVWVQALPAGPTNSTLTVAGTAPATGQNLTTTSPTAAAWQTSTALATGLLTGGVMTPNTPTSFNISAGTGQVVDYTVAPATVTPVTIAAQTVTLTAPQLAQTINWWLINSSGTLINQTTEPTPIQRRQMIQLGATPVVAGAITQVAPSPQYVPQGLSQLYDLMQALGPFSISGNLIQPNGANLNMNLVGGQMFSPGTNYGVSASNPHFVTTLSETPATFYRATRVSGSEIITPLIDPLNYDNAGVLTAVGGGVGSSTLQRVFLFGVATAGRQLGVQYGNTVYGSLAAAVAAVGSNNFPTNPDFLNEGVVIAYIAITRVCTSLADTANCVITLAGKFAVP